MGIRGTQDQQNGLIPEKNQVTSPLCLSDRKCALFSGVGCITEKENTTSKQQDDTATSKQPGYVTYLGKFADIVVRLK